MGREVVLRLTEAEARALLGVLSNHLRYGWIASDGEFGVVVDSPPSLKAGAVYEKVVDALKDGENNG